MCGECVQCGQCGKCGSQDQSRIFGRTWQRNDAFAGSLERQWAMGKEEQDFLKKYLFLEPKSTKVCDLLMFPAHLGKNIFDQGCRKIFQIILLFGAQSRIGPVSYFQDM